MYFSEIYLKSHLSIYTENTYVPNSEYFLCRFVHW